MLTSNNSLLIFENSTRPYFSWLLGTVVEPYLQIKTEILLAKINLKIIMSLISFRPNHSASQKAQVVLKKS